MKKQLIFAFCLIASFAIAQDITNHSVPVGGGPGSVGWKAAGPCTSNQILAWTGGTTADPACVGIGTIGAASVTNSDGTLTISPTTGAVIASVNLAHANIWTGNQSFRSGRPWCDPRAYGALGDGVTDDSAAFASCTAALIAIGGGMMKIGPGTYCVFTGIVDGSGSGASIRFVGDSTYSTTVSTCNHDSPVFTLAGFYSTIENMNVWGKGAVNDTGTFGATQPAILLNANCGTCKLSYINVLGGANVLKVNGAPEIRLENSSFAFGYGGAVLYIVNSSAPKIHTSSFDQSWPIVTPTAPLTISAWTNAHAYVIGDVVSTGGYYIQARVAGTSGAVAPTLKNYNIDISDGAGTLKWRLVGSTNYCGIQLDSGTSEFFGTKVDVTGSYSIGICLTNTLATTGPILTHIKDTVVSGGLSGINAGAGHDLYLDSSEIFGCLAAGCGGLNFFSAWGGGASITNNAFKTNASVGIALGASTNHNIFGNIFTETAAINVTAGITRFIISNNIGAGTVIVNAGASDNYNIVNNIGLAVTDGGAGAAKTVSGNH